jgi:hypothetical protein
MLGFWFIMDERNQMNLLMAHHSPDSAYTVSAQEKSLIIYIIINIENLSHPLRMTDR